MSGCITSLLSHWRAGKRTQPTVSNRADIQYQANVHSLRHNPQLPIIFPLLPAHLLCISAFRSPTTNCFAIYVPFSLSLLCLQAVVRPWWTSLSLSLYVYPQNKTHVQQQQQQYANTQMFSFTEMWNLLLIRTEMQLDHLEQVAEMTCCSLRISSLFADRKQTLCAYVSAHISPLTKPEVI